MDRTREQPRGRFCRRSRGLRTQRGSLASTVFTTMPTNRMTRIEAQHFRNLLCRRLRLPLPSSSRTCRCGRQLDQFGPHRAACSETGVLGKRGFPLECAAAQVCREAGARVTPNAFVRDLDVGAFNGLDGRRIEVIADGLTLCQGSLPGSRHHVGVSSPAGWESEEGRRKAPRRGSGGSAAQERDHIPGVGGRGRTSPSGGVGC